MEASAKVLFADESAALSSLQSYNSAYTKYEMCTSANSSVKAAAYSQNMCPAGSVVISGVTYTSTGSNAPPATGPGAAGSSNAALPAAEKLRADMVTAMGSPNTKTNQQYDASFSSLLTNYAGVLQTRANLDRRLQDLYDDPPETSATGMSKTEMDAALYANILWTILATCIVYFIFMHL